MQVNVSNCYHGATSILLLSRKKMTWKIQKSLVLHKIIQITVKHKGQSTGWIYAMEMCAKGCILTRESQWIYLCVNTVSGGMHLPNYIRKVVTADGFANLRCIPGQWEAGRKVVWVWWWRAAWPQQSLDGLMLGLLLNSRGAGIAQGAPSLAAGQQK